MKRSTTMLRRTAFKRPERVRQPMAPLTPIRRGVVVRCDMENSMSEKFTYIRSPALLKVCRQIPCQNCGRSDGTVCAAHSNQAKHGKGRGIKASDVFVASLCSICHTALDQGTGMTRAERVRMWDACHKKTLVLLVHGGLWPADLPVPIYTPKP